MTNSRDSKKGQLEGEQPSVSVGHTWSSPLTESLLVPGWRQAKRDREERLRQANEVLSPTLEHFSNLRRAGHVWAPEVENLLHAARLLLVQQQQPALLLARTTPAQNKLRSAVKAFLKEKLGRPPVMTWRDELVRFIEDAGQVGEIAGESDTSRDTKLWAHAAAHFLVKMWGEELPLMNARLASATPDTDDLAHRLWKLFDRHDSTRWGRLGTDIVVRVIQAAGLSSKEAHRLIPDRKSPSEKAFSGRKTKSRNVSGTSTTSRKRGRPPQEGR